MSQASKRSAGSLMPSGGIGAILQGDTLKARVLAITTNLSKAKGGPAVAVKRAFRLRGGLRQSVNAQAGR